MNDKLLNLAYEKAKLKDLQGDRKVDSFGAEYDRLAQERNDDITFEEAFESSLKSFALELGKKAGEEAANAILGELDKKED